MAKVTGLYGESLMLGDVTADTVLNKSFMPMIHLYGSRWCVHGVFEAAV